MIAFDVDTKSAEMSLGASVARTDDYVRSVVRRSGEDLHRKVVENASGAPGPEVITGRYRASIHVSHQSSGSEATSTTYSDEEYGARLEYGYSSVGGDGDYQFSEPHPHFRPALEAIEPDFLASMDMIGRVL